MDSKLSPNEKDRAELDPVFLNSRREAIVIFAIWVLAMLWAVPYCFFNGYYLNLDPENLRTIWGIPNWVFWGIVVPWLAADIFTIWFCLFFVSEDDLGENESGTIPDAQNGG